MADNVQGIDLVAGTNVTVAKTLVAGTRGNLASYLISASGGGGAGGFPGPVAKVLMTANQSIGSGAWTVLNWNSEETDAAAMHDNATNNNRLTVPTGEGGTWLFACVADYANNATGIRGLQINKNTVTANTNILAQASNIGYAGISNTLTALGMAALAATDYISAMVFQNSGGSLSVLSASSSFFAWRVL